MLMSLESVVERFSYSKLETYLSCPLQFKYAYVDKLVVEEPVNFSATLGIAVHRALELFFQNIQTLDELLSIWRKLCKNEYFTDPKLLWTSVTHKKLFYNQGKQLLTDFFNTGQHLYTKPTYSVVGLEKSFQITFDRWQLTGFIDKIESHSDKVFICDYKTGKHMLTQQQADEHLQLTFYSLAYRKLYKQQEQGLYLYYLKHNTILKTKRQVEHFEKLHSILNDITQKILNEQFEPKPSYFNCKYCKYNSNCQNSIYRLQTLDWESIV